MSEPPNAPKIRNRIENLSDLVFGLALSIGSIVLISKLPQTPTDLVTGVAIFGFSFLLVVWIWSSYTAVMTALPLEVRGTYVLNVMLLFCVAVEPYLFFVQEEAKPPFLAFAAASYALDVGAMLFILAGLDRILLSEERRGGLADLPPARLRRFRWSVAALSIGGVVFVASALPIFWTPVPLGEYLRFDMWYVVIVVLLVVPRLGRRPAE
jgi:uncharacterized membrane protein